MNKLNVNYETIRILDMPVDNITYEDVLSDSIRAIEENKQITIASMNVQITYLSTKNKYSLARSFFDKATHRIPDGYGVIKAVKWFGDYKLEKLAGVDLADKLFELANEKEYTVYLYGTHDHVLDKVEERLAKEFPNVKVVGKLNGYTKDSYEEIRDKINKVSPNILFVATGFPIQEEFLSQEMSNLDVNVAMDCGGTLDMFVGEQVRASKWWRDNKLEWLYRIVTLRRPERLVQIPLFLYKSWLHEMKTRDILNKKRYYENNPIDK